MHEYGYVIRVRKPVRPRGELVVPWVKKRGESFIKYQSLSALSFLICISDNLRFSMKLLVLLLASLVLAQASEPETYFKETFEDGG